MTVVAFRSSASSGAGNNAVCSKPAGVVSGDCLVAFVFYYDNASATVTPPSGWTSQLRFVESPAIIVVGEILTKIAGGSEPSTYTFTTGQYTNVAILAFTGADQTTPWVTGLGNGASSGVITGLSVSPTRAGNILVLQHVGFGSGAPSTPTGMTFEINHLDSVNDVWYQSVDAGATGTRTAGNPGELWVANMGVIQPPPTSTLDVHTYRFFPFLD